MTKDFEDKIKREGVVDTKMYRYAYKTYNDRAEIQRLLIDSLDTTSALDDWETVKVYR